MAKKNELRSHDLRVELESSLPDAEALVVSTAVTWADQGDAAATALKDAVTNLVAIRSAIAAMLKVHGKAKSEPAPVKG
jgi:hypothetical protein